MPSTYLTRTMGTPTDATKQTLSVWVKIASSGDYKGLVSSQYNSTAGGAGHFLGNSESIYSNWTYNGSVNGETRTTALGRDFSGWYHIVSTQDASESGTDKSKIWINGVLQTSFVNDNRSNFSTHASWFANGKSLQIGRKFDNTFYFDGIMSHLHLCDGYAYQASDFGSFDSATGEWKINTAPSVNYGNQGFFILKDNAGTTDLSGNGNNFTVSGGTILSVKDCPSNVFATMNPLDSYWMSATFSNGNNKVVTQGSHMTSMAATLGASSGKYYWEVKVDDVSGQLVIGIDTKGASTCSNFSSGQCLEYTGERTYAWSYRSNTGNVFNNDSAVSYGNTYTTGDIIGVALDLDNNKIYWSKNGTWQNSGVPTSGSTGTGAISITAASSTDTGIYFPACSDVSTTASSGFSMNFGNGFFGTTAVSSAGTNASNNGVFEYDVPTGYTALSTKGLNL